MYTTIEADIENGWIKSPEIRELPACAHVLITVLAWPTAKRPVFGTLTSKAIKSTSDAFAPLSEKELADWGLI
ncbi:MAG: hypothetical protein WCS52_00540 [bacterium]